MQEIKKKVGKRELTRRVEELFKDANTVDRVIVSFSDLTGRAHNVSLLYDGSKENRASIYNQLIAGLCTDGSSFPGFDLDTSNSDMMLLPDLSTAKVWERAEVQPRGGIETERILHLWADVRNPDGTVYECCPRTILKRAVAKAEKAGVQFMAGSEQEFFVSKEPKRLVHTDEGIYYQDVPVWLAVAARKLMRDRGIESNYIHHEVANSQFEVQVKHKDALSKADDIFLYKGALREAAALQGLSVTFMPKPQDGINGSGMHVHWGMFDLDGKNIMADEKARYRFTKAGEAVVAALAEHAEESSLVHNPSVNSYRRLKPGYEAPVVACWGQKNRTAMFRQPAAGGRIENRVLDGVGSQYLKFAVMIEAALRGLEKPDEYLLDAPVEQNVFHSDVIKRRKLVAVPQNFGAAIKAAKGSELLREALGERAYTRFIAIQEKEWDEYNSALGKLRGEKRDKAGLEWECQRYWNS